MNKLMYIWIILLCAINAQAQNYLSRLDKCEKEIYKIEYEKLYGELKKHIYIHCFINGDTIFNIQATSVEDDTLKLRHLTLVDKKNNVEWFYIWSKYYDMYFLSSISKIEKHRNKGITKIYELFREDPRSVRSYSDYTQNPEFEEYYNIGEKIIDTEIILTFPKLFKEIQGVKEE